MKFNIAIDGPSAAGKSTIAQKLAEKLGYSHLDTGAMYRCVALDAINKNIDLSDEKKIIDIISNIKLEMCSDIGTVVLKDAKIKLYLTATSEARAKRRHAQNLKKGFDSDLSKIVKDIEIRDFQDMNREHSPLKKADDALEVNSSNINIEEVMDIIIDYINKMK